jgi:hypothetical protein
LRLYAPALNCHYQAISLKTPVGVGERNADFSTIFGLWSIIVCAAMKNLATTSWINLSIILFVSLMLLIHSVRPELEKWKRRLTAVTGLLGLPYVAMDLCWRSYIGVIRSWPTAAFYFALHFLGGVSIGMLLSIVLPKKVVLGIASISSVALTLFGIVHYLPKHLGGAIHVSSLGIGLFVGALVSSVSRWFNEGYTVSQNGDVASEPPA